MTNLNNITILVVDDDPLIAHDIAGILNEAGYNAIEPSHTYQDAVDSLKSQKIHLAVLDINLGSGKTGIDIATHIKEYYQLPYIFLTSYSDDTTLEAAQEVSPYGYLVKPFQPPTLLSTIKIALSNHSKLAEQKGLNYRGTLLSDREMNICEKLALGKSYQEIADTEYISLNTVRYHIKNLYAKFEVNSRANLVSKLIN